MEEVLVAGGVGAATAGLYKLLRPTVNCHFCNTNHRVSYHDKNRWICPSCDQYNGFREDGDYNRDLSDVSPDNTRYCTRVARSHVSPIGNGLCNTCNLNQEMKVNLLSRIEIRGNVLDEYQPQSGDDIKDHEEYVRHLESAFKLCPDCQDIVDSKLQALDAIHGAALFEHNLSNSKLVKSVIDNTNKWSTTKNFLTTTHFLLSLMILNMMLHKCIINHQDIVPDNIKEGLKETVMPFINQTSEIFPHISISESVNYLSHTYSSLIIMIMLSVIIGISLIKRHVAAVIINAIILTLHIMTVNTSLFISMQGSVAIVSFILAAGALILLTIPSATKKVKKMKSQEKSAAKPSKMRSLRSGNNSPVLPQEKMNPRELIDRVLQDDTSPSPPPPSIFAGCSVSSSSLVSPSQIMSPSVSPAQVMPRLLRSRNESSFNHEFATVKDDNDDDLMSTLSIGEAPSPRPSSISPPFSLRSYSPPSILNMNINLFSPPVKKPLVLRPSRLQQRPLLHQSQVGGGYWNPDNNRSLNNGFLTSSGPSRCSSQTSGFISATPSVASYQHHHNYPTPPPSVLSEPIPPHPYATHVVRHRHGNGTVDGSISDSSIAARAKEDKKQGWWTAPLFYMTPERLLIVILICALGWSLSIIKNSGGINNVTNLAPRFETKA